MTILERLRTLVAAVDLPRPVRAVAAGAAITWGTLAASGLAEQCREEIESGEARLAELDAAVMGREIQLAALESELESTPLEANGVFLRAAALVVRGELDRAVRARALTLGWAPPVLVDELVEYATRDAESTGQAANVAAAIRFYFSAGGPGSKLPDVDEPAPEPVDEQP